jgi:poly(3-hydroxybutyrate) depolymerase
MFTTTWFTQLFALLLTASASVFVRAAELKSGEYFITQSWSQEKDFKRPYLVHVPNDAPQKALPVIIVLHGNGGSAERQMKAILKTWNVIPKKRILIFPEGYKASWNIVSEKSKADDRGFVEAIVGDVSIHDNVRKDDFTIMGISNGAALANQIAIETRLEQIRCYITGVSPLNIHQFDGSAFKAKGEANNYSAIAYPLTGKRLMNISGTRDALVPYEGGDSKVIPARSGRLGFVAAEESIFIWARHMGHTGPQIASPTQVSNQVETFSYLAGKVVHHKVLEGGHGCTSAIGEKAFLDFLEAE